MSTTFAAKQHQPVLASHHQQIDRKPFPSLGIDALSAAYRNQNPAGEKIQRAEEEPTGNGTRKIVSSHGSSIETGTFVNYSLEQTGDELWSADTRKTYRWRSLRPDGSVQYEKTTYYPSIGLSALYPGTWKIECTILANGSPTGNVSTYSQNVYYKENNTELGGLSVGNFDFKYDGHKASVSIKLKFQFEDTIADTDKQPFKDKFLKAVQDYWTNSGVSFTGTGNCPSSSVPLEIKASETTGNDYDKLVDVTKESRRPKVISDINVYLDIPSYTIAHEFGHVLGLDDEYDGGFLENIMFWHDDGSNQSDTGALMNTGTELRKRYFTNFMNAVQNQSESGCKWKLNAPNITK